MARTVRRRRFALTVLAAAAWTAGWAVLVYPATREGDTPGGVIEQDALHYLDMVRGPMANTPAPWGLRPGAPLVARMLPFSPETSLRIVSVASLFVASFVWASMGRRLGFSPRALFFAALAAGSTQGWVGPWANPYLTDAPGLASIVLTWAAWVVDAHLLALALLSVTPYFRETVVPMALLWADAARSRRLVLALAAAVTPLLVVRLLPSLPPSASVLAALHDTWVGKGPVKLLGDAVASFHALWLLAPVGLALSPPSRARTIGAPLVTMLAAGFALAAIASNTVRVLSVALPFVALAVAEVFEHLLARARWLAYALAATFALGGSVWYPTRPLGAFLYQHRAFQYLFGAAAFVLAVLAVRAIRRERPIAVWPALREVALFWLGRGRSQGLT